MPHDVMLVADLDAVVHILFNRSVEKREFSKLLHFAFAGDFCRKRKSPCMLLSKRNEGNVAFIRKWHSRAHRSRDSFQ